MFFPLLRRIAYKRYQESAVVHRNAPIAPFAGAAPNHPGNTVLGRTKVEPETRRERIAR